MADAARLAGLGRVRSPAPRPFCARSHIRGKSVSAAGGKAAWQGRPARTSRDNWHVTTQQEFAKGDTVRLKGGNDAHLMTVEAASPFTVLCAWFGPGGKVQYAPYDPEDLE